MSSTFRNENAVVAKLVTKELNENAVFVNASAVVAEDGEHILLNYVLESGDIETFTFDLNYVGYKGAETHLKGRARNWRLETEGLFESIESAIEFQGFALSYGDYCFEIKRRENEKFRFPYSVTGYAQCRNKLGI